MSKQQYMVRVIDDRDGWSKLISIINLHTPCVYTPSKKNAYVFTSLTAAVTMRDAEAERDYVRAAWIIHL